MIRWSKKDNRNIRLFGIVDSSTEYRNKEQWDEYLSFLTQQKPTMNGTKHLYLYYS